MSASLKTSGPIAAPIERPNVRLFDLAPWMGRLPCADALSYDEALYETQVDSRDFVRSCTVRERCAHLRLRLVVRDALPVDWPVSRRACHGGDGRSLAAADVLHGFNRRRRLENHRCGTQLGERVGWILQRRVDGCNRSLAVES